MNNDIMNLSVNEKAIRPIIENQIKAGIVRELNKSEDLISMVVHTVLTHKVDREGREPRYSSDAKYDYMEYLIQDGISKTAKLAFQEWITENNKKIKLAVLKELDKPRTIQKLKMSILEAIEKSLKYSWNFSCKAEFYKCEE